MSENTVFKSVPIRLENGGFKVLVLRFINRQNVVIMDRIRAARTLILNEKLEDSQLMAYPLKQDPKHYLPQISRVVVVLPDDQDL